jgi:integrase/recombinase XerD
MNLPLLFEQFIREKKYLLNVTSKTEDWYRQSWSAFTRAVGTPEIIDRNVLNEFIIKLRESGIVAKSVNTYACAINSFLSWLCENEYITVRLKIKPLKEEQKVLKVFSDSHIDRLIRFRPKTQLEWRIHTAIMTLTDTGTRVDECLSLTRADVDFDNLLLTVRGKGQKSRLVPFSNELRKLLWKWLKRHQDDHVFPVRGGGKMGYRSFLQQLKNHCAKLGIEGVRTSPHTFRHHFAIHFLRRGGDLYSLSRILGHTDIKTTQIYLRSMGIEQIRESHTRLSPLNARR